MGELLRNIFLSLSENEFLTNAAEKHGLRMGASRFVAGESIEQAVEVVKKLNENGMVTTINHMGEHVKNKDDAGKSADEYIRLIKAIENNKLDSRVSLKLTSIGLDVADEIAMDNMRRILEAAKESNVSVTIDMEDSERCGRILDIFKGLREEYDNVGTVLQSYLYRTENDLDELKDLDPFLRFVKGAYKEPPEVAFQDKKDILENLKNITKTHLLNDNYAAIATHDDSIIDFTKEFAKEHNIPHDQFEFQMLYGIHTQRQEVLVNEGYTMRIYVPYGKDWYGYYMRRLAERPSYVGLVVKSMFGR